MQRCDTTSRCKRDASAVYPLLPRLAEKKIALAYTGSSRSMQTVHPAPPHRLGAAVRTRRPRKPAAVLAFDLFWQGGPKTSVAVRARAASRAHTASRCARAHRSGAPEEAPRAPPRHTSIYCIEGAAPASTHRQRWAAARRRTMILRRPRWRKTLRLSSRTSGAVLKPRRSRRRPL